MNNATLKYHDSTLFLPPTPQIAFGCTYFLDRIVKYCENLIKKILGRGKAYVKFLKDNLKDIAFFSLILLAYFLHAQVSIHENIKLQAVRNNNSEIAILCL